MKDEQPKLLRYIGRVKTPDGKLSTEYVDWFTNDAAAKSTYRLIMEQQGYTVKNIIVENKTAIVEIA